MSRATLPPPAGPKQGGREGNYIVVLVLFLTIQAASDTLGNERAGRELAHQPEGPRALRPIGACLARTATL
jgi:hypothetical protein